jgi:hypothetical protein
MRLLLRMDFYLAQFELNFDRCFARPDMRPLFHEHLRKFFNAEPLEFIEAVEQFKNTHGDERRRLEEQIFTEFIRADSPKQINLPHNISKNLFAAYTNWSESDESIFDQAAKSVTFSIKSNFFASFTISTLFRKWLYEHLKSNENFIYEIADPLKEGVYPLSQFSISDDDENESGSGSKTTAAVYISTHLPPIEVKDTIDFTYSILRPICSIRFFVPAAFILQLIFVFLFVFLTTFLTSQDAVFDISESQQLG